MINMDMIGRLVNNRLFVGGVGHFAWPQNPVLEKLDKDAGIDLNFLGIGLRLERPYILQCEKRFPVLFFFSGLHTDYHKPSDTADKINAPGAIKVLSLVYGLTGHLAEDATKLALYGGQGTDPRRARRWARLWPLFRFGPGLSRRHQGRAVL